MVERNSQDVRNIPMVQLEVGRVQVRISAILRDIEELETNIALHGLIHAITVAPSPRTPGMYEIVTGQRRYRACLNLGWTEIPAVVLPESVTEDQMVLISLSENVVRTDVSHGDLVTAFENLFFRYNGNIQEIVRQTGFTRQIIEKYVTGMRLIPELREIVAVGELSIPNALRAQDASREQSDDGRPDVDVAVHYAQEMRTMNSQQRSQLTTAVQTNPTASVEEHVEIARRQRQTVRLTLEMTPAYLASIDAYKDASEFESREDAAISLLNIALENQGHAVE